MAPRRIVATSVIRLMSFYTFLRGSLAVLLHNPRLWSSLLPEFENRLRKRKNAPTTSKSKERASRAREMNEIRRSDGTSCELYPANKRRSADLAKISCGFHPPLRFAYYTANKARSRSEEVMKCEREKADNSGVGGRAYAARRGRRSSFRCRIWK